MHQITEQLFVGNIYDAMQPPAHIGALLLVAEEYQIDPPPSGLVYGRIPFKDFGEAGSNLLADAVDWVERHIADNRVMICCRAGMGRSVSVAMAYLCCVEGMAYSDVLKLALDRRPGAMPLPHLDVTIQSVRQMRTANLPSSTNP
jgi:protein-tyrosine phosphatase